MLDIWMGPEHEPADGEPYYECDGPSRGADPREAPCKNVTSDVRIPASLVDTAIRLVPSGERAALVPLAGPMVCGSCGRHMRRVEP